MNKQWTLGELQGRVLHFHHNIQSECRASSGKKVYCNFKSHIVSLSPALSLGQLKSRENVQCNGANRRNDPSCRKQVTPSLLCKHFSLIRETCQRHPDGKCRLLIPTGSQHVPSCSCIISCLPRRDTVPLSNVIFYFHANKYLQKLHDEKHDQQKLRILVHPINKNPPK